jgi:hypothetical protein
VLYFIVSGSIMYAPVDILDKSIWGVIHALR